MIKGGCIDLPFFNEIPKAPRLSQLELLTWTVWSLFVPNIWFCCCELNRSLKYCYVGIFFFFFNLLVGVCYCFLQNRNQKCHCWVGNLVGCIKKYFAFVFWICYDLTQQIAKHHIAACSLPTPCSGMEQKTEKYKSVRTCNLR